MEKCTRLFIILKIDEGDVENIKLCNEGCNSFYTVYDVFFHLIISYT